MIRTANIGDLPLLAEMGAQLWPENGEAELMLEFSSYMHKKDVLILIAEEEASEIGFAICSLRRDYVEGAKSSPVGYIEGIFVYPAYRYRGYSRAMVRRCEEWAVEQGCSEMASDCTVNNEKSRQFHRKIGFREANRIVCFIKSLGEDSGLR